MDLTNAQTGPALRLRLVRRAGSSFEARSESFVFIPDDQPMTTLRFFELAVPLVVGFFLLRDLVREFARPKR